MLALRFDIIDTVRRGDCPFQRRGNEAAHQICAGPHINRGHLHRRIVAARILPYIEREKRLYADDGDNQANHNGQNRTAYKDIGNIHGAPVLSVIGSGRELELGGQRIVDGHRHAVAQLEHPSADDLLPALQPLLDGNEITPFFAQLYELLAQQP